MSRVGMAGKIPMKDAFIMSSLPPPEEDPLLAGLQGVDTVIEHFIKNAQGELWGGGAYDVSQLCKK